MKLAIAAQLAILAAFVAVLDWPVRQPMQIIAMSDQHPLPKKFHSAEDAAKWAAGENVDGATSDQDQPRIDLFVGVSQKCQASIRGTLAAQCTPEEIKQFRLNLGLPAVLGKHDCTWTLGNRVPSGECTAEELADGQRRFDMDAARAARWALISASTWASGESVDMSLDHNPNATAVSAGEGAYGSCGIQEPRGRK